MRTPERALRALAAGFRSLGRNWGLVVLVFAANLGLALVLAVPFAIGLERDLRHTGASGRMARGFDADWWSRFEERAQGPARDFAPDLAGLGFELRSLDILLEGQIPGGLFASRPGPDPQVLALGVLYLLLQAYLTGGLLGVFRAPQGGWSPRGFLLGCGFYFARLLRVSLLALAAAGVVFALHAPLAGWLDGLAREAVSERTALALTLGRRALLLAVLLLVHMASSYARVIVVCEQRRSAFLASLSSLGFCARNLPAALGQYLVVLALGALLVFAFGLGDARLATSGWGGQLLALALLEAFVALRIALRLALLACQVELFAARGR